MTPKYSPSFEFLKISDSEEHRLYEHRLHQLVVNHKLTEQQGIILLLRIDIELSMEFDEAPYAREIYTRKVDEYVDELLNESTHYVKNLLARISETIILEEYI